MMTSKYLRVDLHDPLATVARGRDPMASFADRFFERQAQLGLVVDQQDIERFVRAYLLGALLGLGACRFGGHFLAQLLGG